MSLKQQVHPLLEEHLRHSGRGSVIPANLTLIKVVELLVGAIDNLDQRLATIEQTFVDSKLDQRLTAIEQVDIDKRTEGLLHAYNAISPHITDESKPMVNIDANVYNPRPRGRPRKVVN